MLALFIDPCSRLLFEVMLTEMSHYLKRKNYFTVFGKNIWQSAAICTNIWKPSYSNMHNLLKFYQDIWKLEAFYCILQRSLTLHIEYYIHLENWHWNRLAFSSPYHLVTLGSSYILSIWLLEAAFGNKGKGRQKLWRLLKLWQSEF